ncbi:MAG TPA: glycoside hydrolase family 43 protein [Pyrinomonadaceae bacterium]
MVVLLAAVALTAQTRLARTFTNPLVRSQDSADPWMFYHKGFYYLTATFDPEGGVWLRRAQTLAGLETAEKKKIYDAPETGLRSRQIWAREIHRLGKRWYLYVTASDGTDENHRIYVFESRADDPWGEYDFKGKAFDPANEEWAIDATVLRGRNGRLYLLWCGHVPKNGNGIYIAPLGDPWTLSGRRVLIAQADFDWERVRYPINEAPQVLQRGGKTFVVYSASDTGTPDYALGLLKLVKNGDPLDPKSWAKSPRPVFAQVREADGAVYGPGHNGFFKSPDGREDWIVYHGKETSEYTYRGRRARAKKFTWNADGTPNFGRPVPAGVPLPVPSGEK